MRAPLSQDLILYHQTGDEGFNVWILGGHSHSVHGRGGGRISKKRGEHVLKLKNGTFKVLHIILSGYSSGYGNVGRKLKREFGSDHEKPICYYKGIDLPFWLPWAKSSIKGKHFILCPVPFCFIWNLPKKAVESWIELWQRRLISSLHWII